jgi:hypothetical protein
MDLSCFFDWAHFRFHSPTSHRPQANGDADVSCWTAKAVRRGLPSLSLVTAYEAHLSRTCDSELRTRRNGTSHRTQLSRTHASMSLAGTNFSKDLRKPKEKKS